MKTVNNRKLINYKTDMPDSPKLKKLLDELLK